VIDDATLSPLTLCMAAAAVLYAASGHGGGTAYLALMGVFAVPVVVMRPTALLLNVCVAGLGTARFLLRGHVPWKTLAPLLAGSIPAAVVVGSVQLPTAVYRALLGGLLLIAAARLLWRAPAETRPAQPPHALVLVVVGAALGLLSGLTGIGGGIFLSPLLVLLSWEDPRRTAAAASVFIVVNSLAGLVGARALLFELDPLRTAAVAVVVVAGGAVGSWLAAVRLERRGLLRVLAVVLLLSGAKLLSEGVMALWA
jgi:uncharacterized membrane protein YfcA